MEVNVQNNTPLYELSAKGENGATFVIPIYKKRSLVGRGQACDLTVGFPDVSGIHAVLEIVNEKTGSFKIYDLNSLNGTFLKGEKKVVVDISLEETFFLGNNSFEIRKFSKSDIAPAPLKILDDFPPIQPEVPKNDEIALPEAPKEKVIISERASKVYPLARDEKSEFSEYIFEDQENLFPIFKYHYDKASVEVLITFADHIQSVDYLPQKDGVYSLAGSKPRDLEIEYPYLGKKDKVPFIDIKGGIATVNPLNGYNVSSVGEEKRMNFHSSFNLLDDEIIRFENGDIQIFVRKTLSPPEVAAAPLFRRDEELKKYLLIFFALYLVTIIPLALFQVDEELEKEKVPERIATILYKKKIKPLKKNITKTKKKPKVEQKSPVQKKTKLDVKKTTQVKPKKTKAKAQSQKKSGIKTAKSVKLPKLAKPNKGPTTKRVSRVVPNPSTKAASASRARPAASKISNARARAKGRVDTYRSTDFKANLSSLLKKGGDTRKVKVSNSGSYGGYSGSSVSSASAGATARTAKVSNNVGSLAGVSTGTLDQTKGVSGLVSKRSIYTAGLPYKTVILGGLDPDVIRRILVENIPKFRTCYESVLADSQRAFNGIVRLNFMIGASGHVTKAGALGGKSRLPRSVRSCVVNVLRGIQFPEPMGGGVVEVNQPMNFYPKVK